MLDAEGRRALCRQGQEPEEARVVLCQGGRRTTSALTRMIADTAEMLFVTTASRNRSAAARIQPDQAAEAALQRLLPRRQILSEHPAARRSSLPAAAEASRREIDQGRLFRTLRQRRRRDAHAQHAAARVPAALLLGLRVRIAHAALPAVPDQALQRALRRAASMKPGYAELVREAEAFLTGKSRAVQDELVARDEHGVGRDSTSRRAARLRDRIRAMSHIQLASGHQSVDLRRRRRVRGIPAKAARPASRCSSSAPGRTGATALFPARTARELSHGEVLEAFIGAIL